MMTQSSITSGQEKQFKRFVEAAANRALGDVGPDKDGLQRLLEQGEEFQKHLVASIRRLALTEEFSTEEVDSEDSYPDGYAVKSVAEQVGILQGFFPGLKTGESIAQHDLPPGAEGWFVIPRWEKTAPTHNEAVEKVFTALASSRKFYNYREGQLGPENLRQHERTIEMLQRLGQVGQEPAGDILIVAAQFGLRHRGRSARRARAIFAGNEFGLGAFAVGCMLLTHPERLVAYRDLWIALVGDEFSLGAGSQFTMVPCFGFDDGEIGFGAHWFGGARGGYGSASAFLPR